jgi:hypothetical protein
LSGVINVATSGVGRIANLTARIISKVVVNAGGDVVKQYQSARFNGADHRTATDSINVWKSLIGAAGSTYVDETIGGKAIDKAKNAKKQAEEQLERKKSALGNRPSRGQLARYIDAKATSKVAGRNLTKTIATYEVIKNTITNTWDKILDFIFGLFKSDEKKAPEKPKEQKLHMYPSKVIA